MSTPDETSEKLQYLMMAALDGGLNTKEQAEFEALLQADERARLEFETLKRNQNSMKNLKLTEPTPEFWDAWNQQLFTRIERGAGWVLFTLGALVVLLYGAWMMLEELLADPELAWWLKAAVVMLVTGTLILLVSLVRERWFLHKQERYKNIIR
ncbi:MAG: hypothetical protein LAT75_06185 [Candidatus Cyclonatronum sp.]|uniref:hypothetical protein n=1 Tax=Cyclonatronum sp. TaxID=3024185 RepID=UPI0025C41F36|nr:hypothetical protein [Cyclonatronum sp.]MCC5934049.1 hypothetical protein [Balneolales bacterium]MCH8486436.1 hypothetical protein [Cyclonatronum sp.]